MRSLFLLLLLSGLGCASRRPPPPVPNVYIQPHVVPPGQQPGPYAPMPTQKPAACSPSRRRGPANGTSGLIITSTPAVPICLDGREIGTTPVEIGSLGAGTHDITFLFPGDAVTQTVLPSVGEFIKVHHTSAPR